MFVILQILVNLSLAFFMYFELTGKYVFLYNQFYAFMYVYRIYIHTRIMYINARYKVYDFDLTGFIILVYLKGRIQGAPPQDFEGQLPPPHLPEF